MVPSPVCRHLRLRVAGIHVSGLDSQQDKHPINNLPKSGETEKQPAPRGRRAPRLQTFRDEAGSY